MQHFNVRVCRSEDRYFVSAAGFRHHRLGAIPQDGQKFAAGHHSLDKWLTEEAILGPVLLQYRHRYQPHEDDYCDESVEFIDSSISTFIFLASSLHSSTVFVVFCTRVFTVLVEMYS